MGCGTQHSGVGGEEGLKRSGWISRKPKIVPGAIVQQPVLQGLDTLNHRALIAAVSAELPMRDVLYQTYKIFREH